MDTIEHLEEVKLHQQVPCENTSVLMKIIIGILKKPYLKKLVKIL